MLWILTALILFPILEITVFVETGNWWGIWPIIAAIFTTAIFGSVLVCQQGTNVLHDARCEINSGRAPARQVLEGICLLISAALLILPGFISDAIGFLLLTPPLRRFVSIHLMAHINSRHGSLWKQPIQPTGPTINGNYTDITNHKNSAAAVNPTSIPSTKN